MTSPHTQLKPLADVRAVCKALGGVRSVMALTDAKSPQVVNNWCALNRCAAHTYLIMTEALKVGGYIAPAELWGIVDPATAGQPAESHAAE